jgi:hypothetical protein
MKAALLAVLLQTFIMGDAEDVSIPQEETLGG